MELTEHFFRRESARLVAALTRIFGVHNLALAEDVVQDAFVRAAELWKVRGVPDNPAAWLMTTAKNRALDVVRRERTARTFAPELERLLDTEWTLAPVIDEAFAPGAIRDGQLRMMFSCCHPKLPEEVQLALVLNILCGFSANEIANALLTGRAAIEKRISRGKAALASARKLFELGDGELASRLANVQRALYLLFNEGYHGTSAMRGELCDEARRLVALLREHPTAATPSTTALAALMCLHAARMPARLDAAGELSAFEDQDRGKWDAQLVADGLALLEQSAAGDDVTAYHVEAAIAAAHASAPSLADTNWAQIVALYDRLLAIEPSPVVALNRAVAIGQDDPARGLAELRAIADRERLASYPSDGSLDWVIPEKALDEAVAAGLAGTGAMLFGRRTYDMFASFWPNATDQSPHGPQRSPEIAAMAKWINAATKIVFSTTLREVTWHGSRLMRTLDAATIDALKREPGSDFMVFGSGSVVSRLTELDLVDEYQLVVAPLLLGSGKSLVSGVTKRTRLQLAEATPFPSGNVRLRYVR